MKLLIKAIIEHFWIRNLLLLVALFSLMMLFQGDALTLLKLVRHFIVTTLLYVWLIVHNRLLVEKLIAHKKYWQYITLLMAGLGYYVLVVNLFSEKECTQVRMFQYFSYAVFYTLFGFLAYFAFKYFREQQLFLENKLYLVQMEQQYLKTQLSPHFLFNTLNNIYSYSITASKKTPELILQLSELMRYLIELNKKAHTSLHEEITFIENYLAFEKERLEERCTILFIKNISNPLLAMEPLLFFPLIENAFKHGTNSMEKSYVTIDIKEQQQQLYVFIENKILSNKQPSTYMGIENVEKRLRLLYEHNHDLIITKQDQIFKVQLEVKLKEN